MDPKPGISCGCGCGCGCGCTLIVLFLVCLTIYTYVADPILGDVYNNNSKYDKSFVGPLVWYLKYSGFAGRSFGVNCFMTGKLSDKNVTTCWGSSLVFTFIINKPCVARAVLKTLLFIICLN